MTRAFVIAPVHRGPATPPPLTSFIEYRAESAPLAWFAFIDGRLVARSASASEAQAALSNGSQKGAANG